MVVTQGCSENLIISTQLELEIEMRRSLLGSLAAEMPAQQQLQALQQVFCDDGAAGSPLMGDAALANSLYASVARQLQSGAGPAAFPQVSD